MYKFGRDGVGMQVVLVGNPVLRQETSNVEKFTPELGKLADDMLVTMVNSGGIGIAAPQVGKSIAICIVDISVIQPERRRSVVCKLDGKVSTVEDVCPLLFINPVVTEMSDKKSVRKEGCLSVPDRAEKVERPEKVVVTFDDTDGSGHTIEANDIFARCVQHEIDHLHGILYIDKIYKKSSGR